MAPPARRDPQGRRHRIRHHSDGEPERASTALARFVLQVVGRGGRG